MATVFKPAEAFRNPFCPRMHYKPDVGVCEYSYTCWECCKANQRRSDKRRRDRLNRGRPPTVQDGRGVRAVREYLGLSKVAFARKIGVAHQTVYDWESGKKKMRMDKAEKITPIVARLMAERKREIGEDWRAA